MTRVTLFIAIEFVTGSAQLTRVAAQRGRKAIQNFISFYYTPAAGCDSPKFVELPGIS